MSIWEDADYSTAELAAMMVDCLDEEVDGAKRSGSENVRRFDRLMPILMEEVEVDRINYRVSEDTFRHELTNFLNDIKHEENPGEYFTRNLGELHERLGTKETKTYTIGFPLNLKFNARRKRDSFQSLGHEIERLGRRQWLSDFKEVAEEEEEEESREDEDDPFTDFMEQVPNNFSNRNYTFWKFEIDTCDQKFAVDRLEKLLGYLLGRINAAAHSNQAEGFSTSNSIWPSGWSDLKHPFLYIVFEEGDYTRFYYERDISPRKRFKVSNHRTELFDLKFDSFPEIEYPLTGLEERFVETLRRFQSAISESNREDSFLDYWRAVEALTLTRDNEGMDTVIRRAESHLQPEDPEIFRFRLKRAREKRNKLVHNGVDVSVTKRDQNLLKLVLENLLWLYCDRFSDWDEDDFRFHLENADTGTDELESQRERRAREIELLDNILDAKQYEESIFEKIFLDWMSGRNQLEDAEFRDPWGFFYPVFGVGTDNADVVVVADAPTYPVDEDEEVRKRSQVNGWQPAFTMWESVDEYRDWCSEMLQHANPDGAWDVLRAVADAVEREPDELYYTTLQKDGEFDESLDELEDGEDPAELNEESISKWKPYLQQEIEHVDPDMVIVFGKNTLEAIGDLFDPQDEFEIESVPYEELYVMDRYPVLRFDYWTEIDSPGDIGLENYISSGVAERWEDR